MIEINTRDFGVIQVEDDTIYEFSNGVYGFEEDTSFVLFEKYFDNVPFLYLQSTQNLIPCFLVFEPWDIIPNYEPSISKEDMAACDVSNIDDLILLVIATVPSSIEDLTLNIKSPIALNPKTKKARQVILQNPEYTVRYHPFNQDVKEGSSC